MRDDISEAEGVHCQLIPHLLDGEVQHHLMVFPFSKVYRYVWTTRLTPFSLTTATRP